MSRIRQVRPRLQMDSRRPRARSARKIPLGSEAALSSPRIKKGVRMLFIRCLVSAGIGVLMLTCLSQSSYGQTGDLKVSIGLQQKSVSEHLGIPFEVEVKNESATEVELYPYDVNRLPDVILNIRFESPLALPAAQPVVNDFGFTEVKVPRFGSVSLKGYLQSYLRHLTPGDYKLPYSLRWEYAQAASSTARAKRTVEAKGELQFNVVDADTQRLT